MGEDAHVGQREVAQRGAGRQLRQELQRVAEELQRAQVRRAQRRSSTGVARRLFSNATSRSSLQCRSSTAPILADKWVLRYVG